MPTTRKKNLKRTADCRVKAKRTGLVVGAVGAALTISYDLYQRKHDPEIAEASKKEAAVMMTVGAAFGFGMGYAAGYILTRAIA